MLKEGYEAAKCCSPQPNDSISGYFSHDGYLKVHRSDCENLAKTEADRLVTLQWEDILAEQEFEPDEDIGELDEIDFRILQHHVDFGIDYSLFVARKLSISKEVAFERHAKLRELKLLERVEALMVRYREKVVDNKWIKHRNHTYYGLTDKGRKYLEYHSGSGD
ncbi:MAG: DUF2250 domain-containing protein [Candidatus Zixiibacteriota bacterium]